MSAAYGAKVRSRVQSVRAGLPPSPVVILCRWIGWREMLLSMRPLSRRGTPTTSARYSLCRWRSANCSESARCAASLFATTITPVVSLSRRCTMPGRSTPPTPESEPAQCPSRACTRVSSPVPEPGCTTMPAALFTASMCSSSNSTSSSMSAALSTEGTAAAKENSTMSPACSSVFLSSATPARVTRPTSKARCQAERECSGKAAASSLSARSRRVPSGIW